MRTCMVCSLIARPLPWQTGQGSSTMRPRPRQSRQGSENANPPAPRDVTPVPLQVGQTRGVVPALAPVPLHTLHGCGLVMRNATVSPCTACSKSRVTSVSTSAPRRACWVGAPLRRVLPNRPPRMSPIPPAAPAPPDRALPSRSPRSKLNPPGAPVPPPLPGIRNPPPPNNDRASSYSLRVFSVDNTSYASEISLNFSSDFGSPVLASG